LTSRNDVRSVVSQSGVSQDSTLNEKGTFLFQAKLGDMNVSKIYT